MPDYELILTSTQAVIGGKPVNPRKPLVRSLTLRDYEPKLALVAGIDDMFQWAQEETNDETAPVPQKAIDFWNQCRSSGAMQMYEIQSGLEEWGISFIMKDYQEPADEGLTEDHAVARAAAHRQQAPKAGPLPDLAVMLKDRLEWLQSTEKTLLQQRRQIDTEYTAVREDIQQTNELLMTLVQSGKKAKRAKSNVKS